MISINQSTIMYAIILVIVAQLFLIHRNDNYKNNLILNLIVFSHITINSINNNNQNLAYLFIIKSIVLVVIIHKLVDSKNTHYIIISNYIIILLINTLNFLNIIIIVELLNIIFICVIIINSNIYLNFKKKVYVLLITLNVITLTFFIIAIVSLMSTFRTTDLSIIMHYINNEKYWYIQYILYISIFTKLGLITGPIYNQHLYNNLNKKQLALYLYFYYWILPIVFIQFISVLQINNWVLVIVFVLTLMLNMNKLKNFKNVQSLIYISGQINLIYLQILLI